MNKQAAMIAFGAAAFLLIASRKTRRDYTSREQSAAPHRWPAQPSIRA